MHRAKQRFRHRVCGLMKRIGTFPHYGAGTDMTHQQAIAGHASERYLLEEMPEMERFEFEDALFRLPGVCRGRQTRVDGSPAGGQASPARRCPSRSRPGVPAKVLTSARWWRRPVVAAPWAVAATLAMVASYQSLVTLPPLREAVSPQSLEAVMLRGATRGAATAVEIAPGSAVRRAVGRSDDRAPVADLELRASRLDACERRVGPVADALVRRATPALDSGR